MIQFREKVGWTEGEKEGRMDGTEVISHKTSLSWVQNHMQAKE